VSRHVRNSWKEGKVIPSLILEVLLYTSQFMHSVLRYPLVRMAENISLKRAIHETKQYMKRRKTAITCKFQRSIHKRNIFFLILCMYPAWSIMRLLSRRYDLTLRATNFWKLESMLARYVEITLGDHRRHELMTSLMMWKSLYEQRWNIYKMLQNKYKRNFIIVRPLTVSICTLNDATFVRLDSSSVHITKSKRPYDVCLNLTDVSFERLARLVDMVDVKYTILQHRRHNSDIFNEHQLIASYWL